MKMPVSLKANRNRSRALSLLEVLVVVAVVMVLLVLLASLGGPSHVKGKARRIGCCNNLMEMGISARLWAADHSNSFPMTTSTNQGGTKEVAASVWRSYLAMSNELANPKVLLCPADSRKPAISFTSLRNENINYFLNLDANETTPDALLAGDRNLTTNGVAVKPGLLTIRSNYVLGFSEEMHVLVGNVLLSDGSVRQLGPRGFQELVLSAGLDTNRLVVP